MVKIVTVAYPLLSH